jgi:hypothetical protein
LLERALAAPTSKARKLNDSALVRSEREKMGDEYKQQGMDLLR